MAKQSIITNDPVTTDRIGGKGKIGKDVFNPFVQATSVLNRKVMRTYQDTWNHRCKFLFCCMSRSDQYQVCLFHFIRKSDSPLNIIGSQDSFSEIARLLTDFFRDLDLVPTDIVAGLVLLRKQQKKLQETQVRQVSRLSVFKTEASFV